MKFISRIHFILADINCNLSTIAFNSFYFIVSPMPDYFYPYYTSIAVLDAKEKNRGRGEASEAEEGKRRIYQDVGGKLYLVLLGGSSVLVPLENVSY